MKTLSSYQTDPHVQLRSLYQSLLARQENYDEFKQLLALYQPDNECEDDMEGPDAAHIRETLNQRISQWVGAHFDGLNPAQMLLWRAIVVDQRFNVSLSPWKESNVY